MPADQAAGDCTLRLVSKRVYVAAEVERNLIDAIQGDGRFTIVNTLADAEVLITRTTNRVDQALLDAAPRLELIAQGTSGIDNIDAAAAQERGIRIVSLPGVNANAVAELVIGLIITLTRTVPQYSREMRRGIWNRGDCASRRELRHHLLGIVGLGHVGSRVAALAGALGMSAIAYDPYVEAAKCATLAELLAQSDVVTLHVPLTSETRVMIGSREIASMKRGAILINAARGEVLDAGAALDALAADHLGGLALDVFDPEPPPREWPDDPRLILTPHIAGCTAEAKGAAAELLYGRIVAALYAEP
jgi:phosphoglycerate dehydrogenase-like enzyme